VKGAPTEGKAFCGFKMLAEKDGITHAEVYHATKESGAYNHGAMIDWHDGNLLLTWKNSPIDEDSPGQRILFSQSFDGANWTKTDGKNVMFPSVSSKTNPAALFAGPTAIINGKRYATASPKQMCLFPDPYPSTQLLRRVGSGVPAKLGPPFWGADTIPTGFEEASKREGIVTSAAMDQETQQDVATLTNWSRLPCDTAHGTTKCEACINGCDSNQNSSMLWRPASGLGAGEVLGGGAEYTHYTVPNSTTEVILHRTKKHHMAFTFRPHPLDTWSALMDTDIPDVDANLNAGRLPDGRIYLVSNACPKNADGRDPLTVSTSTNGWDFNRSVGVMSCKQLGGTEKCGPRIAGKAKDKGPSYPQGVAVTSPASVSGLYVVATNNKEDVWVVRVPFSAL
jgi:hypothetical protein